jgi:hypothetical protein
MLALISPKTTSWVLAADVPEHAPVVSLAATHALIVKAQALTNTAACSARLAELRAAVEALWEGSRRGGV